MDKMSNLSGFPSGNKSFQISFAKNELQKKKKTYNSVNLSMLPDKGAKLKSQINELENLLESLTLEAAAGDNKASSCTASVDPEYERKVDKSFGDSLNVASLDEKKHSSVANNNCKTESKKSSETGTVNKPFNKILEASTSEKFLSFSDLTPKQDAEKVNVNADVMSSPSFKSWRDPGNVRKTLLTESKPLIENPLKKSNSQNISRNNPILQANEECVKKFHHSLVTYPDEYKEESEPENMRSTLMLHQKRGLAWLMWREQQEPKGGILADDMGLGKTLSVIALILKQKERKDYCSLKDHDYECRGTLIVCQPSIIHQWDDEITKHCEIDALKVLIYHGPKRDRDIKRMKSYDVVLTTYNIILAEKKAMDSSKQESPLFNLKWERIVLDEAHTIKNHNSQTAQAIFCLKSFRKWAVTGTPIHNLFKDIYSLVKFLQFSPFDDLKKFKGLTAECSDSSDQRRQLLIKSIVLRRTKDQVDEWGKPLIEMKNKDITLHYIELSAEERKVYDKISDKVKNRFNQYLEKTSKSRPGALLVSLLRLQQCCSHLSLLKKDIEESDDPADVADALSSLNINDSSSNSLDSGLDLTFTDVDDEKLDDAAIKSTKLAKLFEELEKVAESSDNKDKSVIVSQWVSMLDIVALHLQQQGIAFHTIAGNTKVEDRQKCADDFNNNEKGAKIMLLSLRAGGVGLNLIGANHLFLLDLHWNPALEMQACDRIHRVGQKKDVLIHKFICKNTIEERIYDLQNSKCRIASSALHGTKQNTKSLTIEDFKMLFGIIR